MSSSGGGISIFIGRRPAAVLAVAALAAAAALVPVVTGDDSGITCDRNATTGTFAAQLSASTGGQTICLAAGTYNPATITTTKSSQVTIRPADGVARSAVIFSGIDVDDASNLKFDGVTATGGTFSGDPTNVDIANTVFTGQLTVNASELSNTGIDITGCTFDDIDFDGGRLFFPERNDAALAGITVSGNHFAEGTADGILSGANGVTIEDNEFEDLVQINGSIEHTDPIQLWGAKNHLIKGNWFHDNDVAAGIMVPDGDVTLTTFEDNVIDMRGSGDNRTFNWGGAVGNTIRHNTLIGSFLHRASNESVPSSGLTFQNNIVTAGVSVIESATFTLRSFNLLGSGSFAGDLTGSPTFVGGTTPTSYAGYRLANGSAGEDDGSDGLDIGIR